MGLANYLRGLAWRALAIPGIHPRDPALARFFGIGQETISGESVSEYTAMNCTAVFQCVRVVAQACAALPLKTYERLNGGGKNEAPDHPTYSLVHDDPSSEAVAVIFWETLIAHVLTWGNGIAEIERTGAGRPAAMHNLTPDRVEITRAKSDGRVIYDVRNPSGPNKVLEASDVLHIPGLGFDGLKGYSVVTMAKQAIGLGQAEERFGATFFGNGAHPSGFLKFPEALTPEQVSRIQESWSKRFSRENANKLAVLQAGAEWISAGVPPDNAQFLESRKFQTLEICRWFNVPPYKLMEMEQAKFANWEQSEISFVTDTMLPLLRRSQQECNRKLFSKAERVKYFVEHVVDDRLRGDIKTRYEAYALAKEKGWMNTDEIRARENLNPLPDGQGKLFFMPLNMEPLAIASKRATQSEDEKSLEFKRQVVLAFLQDGSVNDVVANLTRVRDLLGGLGLPLQEGYVEPWMPVLDDKGNVVTGGVVKDSEGDIVGGESEAPEPVPQPATANDNGKQAENQPGDTQTSQDDASRMIDGLMAAGRPLLRDAYSRVIKVEADKVRKASNKPEFLAWSQEYYDGHGDEIRKHVSPVVDALFAGINEWRAGRKLGAIDSASELAAMAARHVERSRREIHQAAKPAETAETWTVGRADVQADEDILRFRAVFSEKVTT